MKDDDRAYDALDSVQAALEDDDLDTARSRLSTALEAWPELPEAHYLLGQLESLTESPEGARAAYARAVELDADYADAHYALAAVLRELGEDAAALEHDLAVWRLDAAADAKLTEAEVQEVLQLLEGEAERVLAGLPEPFKSALADVPILLEAQPPEALVREGFDPRALGLFEGPVHAERTSVDTPPTPTHIVLFWTNILDIAEDDHHLAEEVEITLLHEIAHYFGLDEEEVAALGLA